MRITLSGPNIGRESSNRGLAKRKKPRGNNTKNAYINKITELMSNPNLLDLQKTNDKLYQLTAAMNLTHAIGSYSNNLMIPSSSSNNHFWASANVAKTCARI